LHIALSICYLPELDRVVSTGGSKVFSIEAKFNGRDRESMLIKGFYQRTVGSPQFYRIVVAPGSQQVIFTKATWVTRSRNSTTASVKASCSRPAPKQAPSKLNSGSWCARKQRGLICTLL
jgi:hypothetical protein